MAAGNEERRDLARAALHQGSVFALDHVEPADAGADVYAYRLGIVRRRFSGRTCCIASSAAAMAKWMKRPIFLTSFFSMNLSGSKFFTSAAIWQENWLHQRSAVESFELLDW